MELAVIQVRLMLEATMPWTRENTSDDIDIAADVMMPALPPVGTLITLPIYDDAGELDTCVMTVTSVEWNYLQPNAMLVWVDDTEVGIINTMSPDDAKKVLTVMGFRECKPLGPFWPTVPDSETLRARPKFKRKKRVVQKP